MHFLQLIRMSLESSKGKIHTYIIVQNTSRLTTTAANNKIPYVSAFSTLVENADTLEDARKMRKNARIRKFLTCPHFPL